MKFITITPFAATAVLAAKTHLKEYDLAGYDDFFYGDYAEPAPINKGEVFYEGQDPYVTPHYDVDQGHYHGDGHDHGPRRHGNDYHEPVPVYHAPEPVYHAPEPVYHEPVRQNSGYEVQYYAPESYGNVPTGDFWNQVSDFNEWNPIWDQVEYEERIQTEAELMISLEALREAMVELDYEIDDLEDCIEGNNYAIHENYDGIKDNDWGIEENDREIDDQRYRLKSLQKQCRICDARLWEDRDALVLYCQQFAFAKDMVGACADILTCRGT